jgi:hypothetical protein
VEESDVQGFKVITSWYQTTFQQLEFETERKMGQMHY